MNIQNELNKIIKNTLQKNRRRLRLCPQDKLEGLILNMQAEIKTKIEKVVYYGNRIGEPEFCGILKYKWITNEPE